MTRETIFVNLVAAGLLAASGQAASLRAGAAQVDITPEEPVWMAGYAARTHPSEGVRLRLKAKALALEDAAGQRVVLISTDLIGLPHELTDWVAARIQSEYGLERAHLVLNSSHTHAGPVVRGNRETMYELTPEQTAVLDRYRRRLADELMNVAGAALGALKPARIDFAQGEAHFAVNRRVATPKGYVIGVNPRGPSDPSVPVLRVTGLDGKVLALLFGYACHNTTLGQDFYQISGDYAGYAQQELEREFPGAVALFFQLCGGDQNPNPRSTVELAQQHGRALAAEVARVAKGTMSPVSGRLKTAFRLIELPLAPHTREQFEAEARDGTTNQQRRAARMLKLYDERKAPRTVEYPVQAVRFEHGFTLIALGGEVVVEYALWARREFVGEPLMVAGYSNDVMSYIPTAQILAEGGYEPLESMVYYGMPGPYTTEVEDRVKSGITAVWKRVTR